MIPNGANIEVTEANKIDYISKMVEFRLTDGVKVRIKKLKFTMISRGRPSPRIPGLSDFYQTDLLLNSQL